MSDTIDPLEALVAACEQAFAGDSMDEYDDDEDVSHPGTGITFGMIRRARAALPKQRDGLPAHGSLLDAAEADLVVVDGMIVKNRWGSIGTYYYRLLERPGSSA